ncbi:hypothetical protein PthstB1num2_20860 [Parageobacillus thermoglucosidasius]|nr:hypothetical protein PthstB1num2_20860 [Parageobacillus thermoglucosidasius]
MLQTISFWSSEYGNDFFSWPLYKSSNSSFIHWLNEESCGKFEEGHIEHYVFITPNEIIEVLSATPPQLIRTAAAIRQADQTLTDNIKEFGLAGMTCSDCSENMLR